MKTGKTIVRVLAVILLLSMLVGFTPAMPTAAVDDTGAVVLADGDDNAVADTGDDIDPAGGDEGGNDPAPGGDDPAPGGGEEPDPEPVKVAVTLDGNVTVMAGDAEIKNGDEVEAGTELAITVKTANVAAAILVNGKECGGKYTVSDEDEAVNITAFGIMEAPVVSPAEWAKTKSVVVKTFGADSVSLLGDKVSTKGSVSITVQGDYDENGKTVDVFAMNGTASVKTTVTIAKIDNKAPVISTLRSSRIPRDSVNRLYYFTIEENGSGVDPSSLILSGSYTYNGKEHLLDTDDIEITYNADKKRYEFTAPNSTTFEVEKTGWFGIKYTDRVVVDNNYTVVCSDKVGNRSDGSEADSEGAYWNDNISPEIEAIAFDDNSYPAAGSVYCGPNSKLTVSVKDESKQNQENAEIVSVELVSVSEDEVGASVAGALEIHKEGQTKHKVLGEATFDFSKEVLQKDGSYAIRVTDGNGNTNDWHAKDALIAVKFDNQAPNVNSVTLDQHTRTAYENVVHALTGGVMFKEQVQVTVQMTEKDASGVQQIVYSFDGGERTLLPGAFNVSKDGLTYTFNVQLPKADSEEIEKGEKGKITVKLVDNVSNESETFTVTYVPPTEDGSGEAAEAIFDNSGTTYDNGKVTVFAYHTPDGENAPIPYTGDWTKSVEFDVRYDMTTLEEQYPTAIPENPAVGDEYWTIEYKSLALTATPEDGAALTEAPVSITETENGVWTATYGADSDPVACDGNLSFTVTPNIEIHHYVYQITQEAADAVVDENGIETTPAKDEIKEFVDVDVDKVTITDPSSIKVPVKVQNFIEPAVINVDGTTTQDGWFNGLDNQLKDVTVTAPRSKAPIVTEYVLEYAPISGRATSSEGNIIDTALGRVSLREGVKEDGLYTVKAVTRTVDDAEGLKLTADTNSVAFKYDVTPANIYVTFADDQESHKDANGIYYDEQRTARVTIMDKTFTDNKNDSVKDYEQFAVEILKTYGAEPQILSDWTFKAAEEGKGGTWTRTYTYGVKSNDAKRDGDNYQVTVAVTDKAGNTSATDTQGAYTGNNETGEKSHYTSANGELFTVDQTVPVVSVSFNNNNNVRNGKYFNAARTATITVVEHNFDPARVTLTATGASAGATASEGWSQNGDTWTKTVTFARDANCKFSIDVVDKAGNVCPNANVKYSGVATADFVIDLTRPNVQYTGVDASPYAEACTPGFTATDTNLGNEFTYKLTRKTMKGEQDVTNLLNHAGTAARFSYSDIPNSRDDDGIYTFTCSVTDLAGNVTTLNPVEFAVNRHGSVYLLNKELQNVVGKYFNEDGWAKVNDDNLVITEYNPTPLKDDAKLEIYRDGTRVATYTGDALKKLVSGGDRGGLGLYEYAYKLPAADFAEDGSYRVVLSSTDANDHKSGNDKTGAEINFVIDTVSPEIVSISGLEKRTVNAEEQPVGFHILDTYGLDSVAIRTAGPDGAIVKEYISQAKYDAQNGKLEPYQQLLPKGELDLTDEIILIQNNTPYHVVISVTDKAGNTTVADGGSIVSSTEAEAMTPAYDFQDSVTVSTNFFVRYIHNTGALVGTGVGAVAIAGLWLVLAKRRKDDEEKKTA